MIHTSDTDEEEGHLSADNNLSFAKLSNRNKYLQQMSFLNIKSKDVNSILDEESKINDDQKESLRKLL